LFGEELFPRDGSTADHIELASARRRQVITETMGDINFEATEDPLKDLASHRVQEDEEDEEGAGVDYRRLFKG
jgi:hypothetical protein